MTDRIYADGLRELVADLLSVDKRLAKTFQVENKRFAMEVADAVRIAYGRLYPVRSASGFDSIKGSASAKNAVVAEGSTLAPYVLGQDFGSDQGPHKQQFPQTVKGGRVLYPTISHELPELVERYAQAIQDAVMGLGNA